MVGAITLANRERRRANSRPQILPPWCRLANRSVNICGATPCVKSKTSACTLLIVGAVRLGNAGYPLASQSLASHHMPQQHTRTGAGLKHKNPLRPCLLWYCATLALGTTAGRGYRALVYKPATRLCWYFAQQRRCWLFLYSCCRLWLGISPNPLSYGWRCL